MSSPNFWLIWNKLGAVLFSEDLIKSFNEFVNVKSKWRYCAVAYVIFIVFQWLIYWLSA